MRRRALALLVLASAVAFAPSASAEAYTNSASHYHFTAPDGWAQQNYAGVDVVFAAPTSVGGFTANLNALHAPDGTAKNEHPYLESLASVALSQLQSQLSGNVVQGARSFTTGSGRPAADYILDYSLSGTPLRVRQVVFGSDILDMGWVLTFTAAQSAFGSYAGEWDTATDSFGVDAEVARAASPFLLMLVVGTLVGGVVGGLLFVIVRRRNKRALAALPPVAPASGTQAPVYAPYSPPVQAPRPPISGPARPAAPPRPPSPPPPGPPPRQRAP